MNNNIQILLKCPSLIRILIENPSNGFTPNELSKRTGISYPTVWRHVHELHDLGVISIEKIGRYNVCRLNQSSPVIPKVRSILDLEQTLDKIKNRKVKKRELEA